MLTNIDQAYQLSPMQKDVLAQIDARRYPGAPVLQVHCAFSGDLNLAGFELAWQHVLAQHAMLRTSFCLLDQIEPLQIVQRQVPLRVAHTDLRGLPAEDGAAQIRVYCQADQQHSFDPERAPLMRLMLFQQPHETYLLVWSLHPLLLDTTAQLHVLDDVFSAYDVLCQGYEPLLQINQSYQHYVARIQQQRRAPIEQFWREQLAGASPTTLGRPARARRPLDAASYQRRELTLSRATAAALDEFARQRHVSLAALAHGAWAIVLSRYAATGAVVFGTTLTQQEGALASIVGLCAATVPLRLETPPSAVIWTWLRQIDVQLLAVRQHRYAALSDIRRWRGELAGPLFESAVLCEKTYGEQLAVPWSNNLELAQIAADRPISCPLTLIVEHASQMSLELVYDAACFDESLIDCLLKDVLLVFQQIVADPYQRVDEIVLYHEPVPLEQPACLEVLAA